MISCARSGQSQLCDSPLIVYAEVVSPEQHEIFCIAQGDPLPLGHFGNRPQAAPSSDKLAFVQTADGTMWQLGLLKLNGSSTEYIAGGYGYVQYDWLDSNRLIISHYEELPSLSGGDYPTLFLYDGRADSLTKLENNAWYVGFDERESQLLVLRPEEGPEGLFFTTLDDLSHFEPVTTQYETWLKNIDYSPTTNALVYSTPCDELSFPMCLFVENLDTHTGLWIRGTMDGNLVEPQFSPTGRYVAFQINSSGSDIEIYDTVEGRIVFQELENEAHQFTWLGDDRLVVLTGPGRSSSQSFTQELFVVDPNSQVVTQLSDSDQPKQLAP